MGQAGISSLGVKFGWAAYSDEKPSAYRQLTRVSSIGEINLETEQIDASALEDMVSRYIAGRQDTGGSFDVVINLTDETKAEWDAVIAADTDGKGLWFTVYSPYLEDGFYVIAQPPKVMPMPAWEQNGLATATMSLTINEYKGMMDAVEPTASIV